MNVNIGLQNLLRAPNYTRIAVQVYTSGVQYLG